MDMYGCTVLMNRSSGQATTSSSMARRITSRTAQQVIDHECHGGDGWERLCPFLNKPILTSLSQANVTQIRWMNTDDLVSIAKEAGQEILRAHNILSAHADSQDAHARAWLKACIVRLARTMLDMRGGRPAALPAQPGPRRMCSFEG